MAGSAEERKLALKAACHLTLGKLCDAEAPEVALTIPKQTVATLTELFVGFADNVGQDLESFCRHRGGKIVKGEDVKLCARKNEMLSDRLAEYHQLLLKESQEESKQSKKRKKGPAEDDVEG